MELAFARHCAEGGDAATFAERILWHARHGYVYSGADAFLLAEEVGCDPDGLALYRGGDWNCWFVDLAAGRGALGRFIGLAPWPHEYFAYHRTQRDQRLRVLPWEKGLKYGR